MRPSKPVDKRHSVLTKTNDTYSLTSRLLADSQTTLRKIFCFFFPTLFMRRDNGAVWLSPIAINLFATQSETQSLQTKSLQSLSHVGFFKTILATPKQSIFIFAKRQAKTNKLCCSPTKILHPP